MPKIKITNLLPMPTDIRRGRKSKYISELRKMLVGSCFAWPENLRGNAYRMAKRAGFRVKTTKENAPRNKVNVFRVS